MNHPMPEVDGDFIPLRVTFSGEPHVICVGDAYENTARVQVNGHECGIDRGKWTSPPLPYYPGVEIVVTIINLEGKSKEIRTALPGPNALGPVFGPEWEPFGPGVDEPLS